MVQMVFVHGVNTRRVPGNTAYDDAVADRDRRFTEVAFADQPLNIANPYWGDFGAAPKWQLACIPKVGAAHVALNLGGPAIGGHVLLDAARQDFPAVVAALSAVALAEARGAGNEAEKLDSERFWIGAARYAERRPAPPWLAQVQTDAAFLDRLRQEAEAEAPAAPAGAPVVGLGLLDRVKTIGARIQGGLSNLVNSPIARVAREKVSPHVAIFLGDVFRYLKDGDGRGEIRDFIIAEIRAAALRAANGNEKLVLAGHSMGGVILYDILADPAAVREIENGLPGPLRVDLLLSIGSQVALFEELKVYAASDPAASSSGPKAVRPAPVALWWNVFDTIDVLSFLCEPVFADVTDFAVDTVAGVVDAHGAYFDSMVFYARLNKRLDAAGLLT